MDDVRAAVDRLVSAFGEGRLDDYFACFASDATFVFHTTPQQLRSTQEYRDLWARWVAEDGFRVRSCRTSDTSVELVGPDAAVVVHDVTTEISTHGRDETLLERDTIVLARRGGRWLAVHEHLSPRPAPAEPTRSVPD